MSTAGEKITDPVDDVVSDAQNWDEARWFEGRNPILDRVITHGAMGMDFNPFLREHDLFSLGTLRALLRHSKITAEKDSGSSHLLIIPDFHAAYINYPELFGREIIGLIRRTGKKVAEIYGLFEDELLRLDSLEGLDPEFQDWRERFTFDVAKKQGHPHISVLNWSKAMAEKRASHNTAVLEAMCSVCGLKNIKVEKFSDFLRSISLESGEIEKFKGIYQILKGFFDTCPDWRDKLIRLVPNVVRSRASNCGRNFALLEDYNLHMFTSWIYLFDRCNTILLSSSKDARFVSMLKDLFASNKFPHYLSTLSADSSGQLLSSIRAIKDLRLINFRDANTADYTLSGEERVPYNMPEIPNTILITDTLRMVRSKLKPVLRQTADYDGNGSTEHMRTYVGNIVMSILETCDQLSRPGFVQSSRGIANIDSLVSELWNKILKDLQHELSSKGLYGRS
ncbi:gamma-glutamylcyclotransferase [Patescibacteria group bacterium]|nr:gamma-glutamylcyclotransferase [Patescibacteria group bacterium]